MNKIRGKYLLVVLAICGLTASALGMLTNISGLFFTPIAEELGLGRGSVSATLTISNLVFAVGGIASARIVGSKNFKPALVLGTGFFVLGTAGLAASSNLIMLYLLNGVRGFAAGIVGNVLVTTVINNWFHTGTGFVTSIAMGCSGIAGAILSPMLSAVIENLGWRAGYLCAAAIIAALNLPAILLPIGFKPQDAGMEPMGGQVDVSGVSRSSAAGKLSSALLVLAITYAAMSAYPSAVTQHFPGIAGSYEMSAAVGSVMISVCMVANTAGKVMFGVLADRLGTRFALLLYSVLIAVGAAVMLLVHVPWAMFAAAVLFGFSYALPTVGAVLVTKELFGLERYGRVYPKINLGTTIANALGTSLIGFLYDATGAYAGALLLVLAVMSLVVAVVIAAYGRAKAVRG